MATSLNPLPPALGGEMRKLNGRAGPMALYVAGDGPPLMALHSINAAASAYEVKPIFEGMQTTHRVYAPDLPGFGHSDRSDRRYDIALYVDAVRDVMDAISADHPGVPVEGCGVSLSCEFMARHVVQEPHRYRTLCMVTPTGFSAPSKVIREGPPGKSREIPGLYKVVSFRPWSQALFDGLASRASIRFFLKRTYGSDDIHEDMFEYDYATAHQPGARFAPLAFLSGRLFSADARDLFRKIELPVWVPHATRGDFKDFSGGDWARERPNWKLHPMPTGALVHFERTGDFLARYRLFLEGPTDA